VEYGLTTSYGLTSTLNTTLVTSHSVILSGLTPNTPYNFRVKSRDAAGNLAVSTNQTFTTAAIGTPPPPPILRKILIDLDGTTTKTATGTIQFINPITRTIVASQSFVTNSIGEYTFTVPSALPASAIIRIIIPGYLPKMLTGADLTTASLTTITIPKLLAGDFNGDGFINTLDHSVLSRRWNQISSLHDLNRDGIVNSLDYMIMINNFYQKE
jgi:hypothetical protein